MKKITEIPEIKKRTRYKRDRQGKLYHYTEEYKVYKQVPTISGKERINHYFTDQFIFILIFTPLLFGLFYVIISLDLRDIFEVLIAIFIFNLIGFAIVSFYYIYYEFKHQQTPGQKGTKSIVIDEYGNKPTLKMIIKRTLLRCVPFEPYSCLGNPSYGLHDKWSKTFVIKKDELQRLIEEINNLEK